MNLISGGIYGYRSETLISKSHSPPSGGDQSARQAKKGQVTFIGRAIYALQPPSPFEYVLVADRGEMFDCWIGVLCFPGEFFD